MAGAGRASSSATRPAPTNVSFRTAVPLRGRAGSRPGARSEVSSRTVVGFGWLTSRGCEGPSVARSIQERLHDPTRTGGVAGQELPPRFREFVGNVRREGDRGARGRRVGD